MCVVYLETILEMRSCVLVRPVLFVMLVAFSRMVCCVPDPTIVENNGTSYMFFVQSPTDYQGAKSICQSNNASLVKITSEEKNEFVTRTMETLVLSHWYKNVGPIDGHNGIWSYWMNAREDNGVWKFDDGTPMSYMHWLNNSFGRNPSGDGACIEVYLDSDVVPYWNDEPCSGRRVFVCEVSGVASPPVTTHIHHGEETVVEARYASNRKMGEIILSTSDVFWAVIAVGVAVVVGMAIMITCLCVIVSRQGRVP